MITLFHVFEHLDNPSQLLKLCYKKLKKYGSIIIEVPHAKDALLTTYNSDSFRKFTLWSEHIILHTNESLNLFLNDASFKLNRIEGFQRYPLSNHLYWLAYNKPGGHEIWNHLNSVDIENAYSNALKCNNSTDTIIAFATKS